MKQMNRKYRRPPIVEAVCEFYFDMTQWDDMVPGLYYDRVRKQYPRKKELQAIAVEIGVGTGICGSRVTPGGKRYQFISDDEKRIIQIERNLLVVNQLRMYPHFESWKPIIISALKQYCALTSPRGIKRLGMRYLNRIEIPSDRFTMEDYFQVYPEVPRELGGSHGQYLLRLEMSPVQSGHQLLLTLGTAPVNRSGISGQMLDLYDVIEFKESLPPREITAAIDEAHENIETVFENCITDKLRELFDRKGES